MSDDATRSRAIESLVGDPSMRNEVIDRLLATPDDREALLAKVAEDDATAGALVQRMMGSERGQAVAASRISADGETLRTFIGMMMVTGALGEIMSQEQADCLVSALPDQALVDLRLNDAWGRPFLYKSNGDGSSCVLVSYASDGKYDELGRAGPTSSYNADIVFSDGDFVQWPGHILKEDIR